MDDGCQRRQNADQINKVMKNNFLENNQKPKGQVILEFTFCMIILLLLIYGCIKAFRWAGVSLADRRITHESTLFSSPNELYSALDDGPLKQINPDFYKPLPMNLMFNKW